MKELKTVREVAEAILEGKDVETLRPDKDEWIPVSSVYIQVGRIDDKTNYVYRINPTKPSINWEHVSDEFNYLSRNKNGKTYLYENEPEVIESFDEWTVDGGAFAVVKAFKSLEVGDCHWTDSLVKRPNNEDEEQK